jgi:antitoxin ParD1/3/4
VEARLAACYPRLAKTAKDHPTMATMNVSLPDPLKQFVDDEVREGGYASTSDYMRDLIRQRQRAKAEELLRRLIAEGMASGPAEPLAPDFFDRLRARARARDPK